MSGDRWLLVRDTGSGRGGRPPRCADGPAGAGRGRARVVGAAAVAHALAAGLLPQWRARDFASRRVAAALGFEELGAQLSFGIA
nr:GNAT family N-acetyltransferase [Streptomyces sp. RO-S4]